MTAIFAIVEASTIGPKTTTKIALDYKQEM